MCTGSMSRDWDSEDKTAKSGWTSAEQEMTALIEDLISSGGIPPEIASEAMKLHDSGHPRQALKILLEALD